MDQSHPSNPKDRKQIMEKYPWNVKTPKLSMVLQFLYKKIFEDILFWESDKNLVFSILKIKDSHRDKGKKRSFVEFCKLVNASPGCQSKPDDTVKVMTSRLRYNLNRYIKKGYLKQLKVMKRDKLKKSERGEMKWTYRIIKFPEDFQPPAPSDQDMNLSAASQIVPADMLHTDDVTYQSEPVSLTHTVKIISPQDNDVEVVEHTPVSVYQESLLGSDKSESGLPVSSMQSEMHPPVAIKQELTDDEFMNDLPVLPDNIKIEVIEHPSMCLDQVSVKECKVKTEKNPLFSSKKSLEQNIDFASSTSKPDTETQRSTDTFLSLNQNSEICIKSEVIDETYNQDSHENLGSSKPKRLLVLASPYPKKVPLKDTLLSLNQNSEKCIKSEVIDETYNQDSHVNLVTSKPKQLLVLASPYSKKVPLKDTLLSLNQNSEKCIKSEVIDETDNQDSPVSFGTSKPKQLMVIAKPSQNKVPLEGNKITRNSTYVFNQEGEQMILAEPSQKKVPLGGNKITRNSTYVFNKEGQLINLNQTVSYYQKNIRTLKIKCNKPQQLIFPVTRPRTGRILATKNLKNRSFPLNEYLRQTKTMDKVLVKYSPFLPQVCGSLISSDHAGESQASNQSMETMDTERVTPADFPVLLTKSTT